MTSQSSMGAGFKARFVGNGTVREFLLLDHCLNYDISDGLKEGLKQSVEEDLEQGQRAFMVDLKEVETVDSCGVGVLISVHHQVVAAGGTVAFLGCNSLVKKVLQMMRLDRFLAIFPDREKALRCVLETS